MAGIFSVASQHSLSSEVSLRVMRQPMVPGPAAQRQALPLSMAQKRSTGGGLTGPEQLPPPDFHAIGDRILPRSLTLSPLPRKLASQFPMISRDDDALLKNDEALLANPQTRKVVAVIKDWSDAGLGGCCRSIGRGRPQGCTGNRL
jgi:hypothetical protein